MRPSATDIRRSPAKPLDLRPKAASSRATVAAQPSPVPTASRYAQPAPVRPGAFRGIRPRHQMLKSWLAYPAIVILATIIGLASSSLAVGQWFVVLYAGVAIWRLPSQVSFGLGLLTLVLVPIFTLLGRTILAENYAVYAYYFLVIGVVQAVWELRRDRRDH
jgi:hypothetical protein